MAELDVASVFSTQVQGYATLGASIVLGVITIYGYYRKLKVDLNSDAQPAPTPVLLGDAAVREIVGWLSRLLDANVSTAHNVKVMRDLLAARQHQEELDRAYKMGRDAQLDRNVADVAHALKDQTSNQT